MKNPPHLPSPTNSARPTTSGAPPGWADVQDTLAFATNLAILLFSDLSGPALVVSNDNSICRTMQASPAHAHLCAEHCGSARPGAEKTEYYRCHAGLRCLAMPVELEAGDAGRFTIIGGRAFCESADYRNLIERSRTGDLQDLPAEELFANIIFATPQDLESLAARLAKAASDYRFITAARPQLGASDDFAPHHTPNDQTQNLATNHAAPTSDAVPKQLKTPEPPRLLNFTPQDFYNTLAKTLNEKFGLTSFALLLNDNRGGYEFALVAGALRQVQPRLSFAFGDVLLREAAQAQRSVLLYADAQGALVPSIANTAEEGRGGISDSATTKAKAAHVYELFPLIVGAEIGNALLVGSAAHLSDEQRAGILELCRALALPLEVLRLRHELEKHTRFADSLRHFAAQVNEQTPAETYHAIIQHSVELLRAERGSLLLFDEASDELAVKAMVGTHAEAAEAARVRLGQGVAGRVLQQGRPLVVRDLSAAGYHPAAAERRYKTESFISYPIIIGGRKVGVLNVTDKQGGGAYDDVDLDLLETIAPQVALALDCAGWREKAARFELMSITDPLTGLLNRRYLEERLAEELSRSERHGYAVAFMMLDIDDFKFYNDCNGHQAGDLALEMTAQCLKSALRSDDVAARYGGEEFCILLPQTSLAEAHVIAERIRRRVERTRYPHGHNQPLGAVTVSIGLCSHTPARESSPATPAGIIRAADRALYQAKHQGKNCVQTQETNVASSPAPDTFAEDSIIDPHHNGDAS